MQHGVLCGLLAGLIVVGVVVLQAATVGRRTEMCTVFAVTELELLIHIARGKNPLIGIGAIAIRATLTDGYMLHFPLRVRLCVKQSHKTETSHARTSMVQ